MKRAYAAVLAYITAIVAANWLANRYGFVPVGFGQEATAGTYAAGLALLFRDAVQETAGRLWTALAIIAGCAITYTISPSLALASAAAFLLAEALDMGVYTSLRRKGLYVALVASGVAGAILDTIVFLHLAHFGVTWEHMQGQLIGKILWATLLPVAALYGYRRVVRR